MGNLFSNIQGWVTTPFTTNMSAVQIFLLVGLLIVAFVVWAHVIARIQEAV